MGLENCEEGEVDMGWLRKTLLRLIPLDEWGYFDHKPPYYYKRKSGKVK